MASSPPTNDVPAVFCVRRKRSAEPLEALIVSVKRPKQSSSDEITSLVFRLTATSDQKGSADLPKALPLSRLNVLDFDPTAAAEETASGCVNEKSEAMEVELSEEDPLAALSDAVGQFGGPEDIKVKSGSAAIAENPITVNGTPLAVVDMPNADDFVFDFYWDEGGKVFKEEVTEVRCAKPGEINLYVEEGGTDSSEDGERDWEEDDSNSENNWRNDYPDEEDESQDDTDDSDGENMHRRFEDCEFFGSDEDGED